MAASNKSMTEAEWNLLGNIGDIYKELRLEAGISQKAAAEKAASSQARVCYLEGGKKDIMITTLNRWANVYGYELEINLVPLPTEGEYRINDEGTMDHFTGGLWREVEAVATETLQEECA